MIDYGNHFKEVEKEFKELLEQRKKSSTKDEKAIQEFIEKNPFCLLSALGGIDANYSFLGSLIISQPKIKSSDGDRLPDFLVVSQNSLNLYFNFIEIEDPSKKIFKKTEQNVSRDFSQAYNQLIQWKSFSKSEVQRYCDGLRTTLFNDNFNIKHKTVHFNFILVYGWSDEILNLSERHNNILQGYFSEPNMKHCTYSRLINELRFEQPFFTVKKDASSNSHKAIGFAPFKNYTIHDWSDLHNVTEKQSLIEKSDFYDAGEKKELISQINNLDSKSLLDIIELSKNDFGSSVTSFDDLDF